VNDYVVNALRNLLVFSDDESPPKPYCTVLEC